MNNKSDANLRTDTLAAGREYLSHNLLKALLTGTTPPDYPRNLAKSVTVK
jgi:hypothetical protein